MIRRGFLTPASRKELTELARDGSAAHRLARWANALVLLDDDTIRTWYQRYEAEGLKGLASFRYEGGACRLSIGPAGEAEGVDQ
jgi:hypothetical protein